MHLRSFMAAAVLLSASLAARADTYAFDFNPGSPFIDFTIDTSGGVADSYPGESVSYFDTNGDRVTFYSTENAGGLSSDPATGFEGADGPQLYTGPESSPAFITGLPLLLDDVPAGNVPITLTITDLSTATTPEPSSFALLGTGLLGTAGVLRKRFA